MLKQEIFDSLNKTWMDKQSREIEYQLALQIDGVCNKEDNLHVK